MHTYFAEMYVVGVHEAMAEKVLLFKMLNL